MKCLLLTTAILFFCLTHGHAQFQSFRPLSKVEIKTEIKESTMQISLTPENANLYLSRYRKLVRENRDSLALYLRKKPNNNMELQSFGDSLDKYGKKYKSSLRIRDSIYNYHLFNGKSKWWEGVVPLRTAMTTDFFYNNPTGGNFKTLESITLHVGSGKSVIATDLLNAYWGVFRFNLSSTFYNGNEDTTATLIDKINNGGGLFAANLNYPLYFRRGELGAFCIDFNTRGSADINAFGTEIPKDEFIGYFEPSLNPYAEFKFRGTDLRMVFQYKFGLVFPTKPLARIIGKTNQDFYDISLLQVGLNVKNRFKITANIPLNTTNGIGESKNFTVGVQYFPGKN